MNRFDFIFHRLVQLIPVLLGISIVTFVLAQLIPGDPVRAMLGGKGTQEAIDAIRARYGLDQPIIVQYFVYMKNLFQGDLGVSLNYRAPVVDVILGRFAPSLFLLVYGVVLSIIFTITLSVAATRNQGGWLDQLVRIFCTVGLGLPAFWLGIMFSLFFSVRLGWFPVSGFGDTFLEHLHHLFLPALTLSVALTPILVRNLRTTILEQTESDFVTAGRSKGLPESYVFCRHIFPNSLLPTLHLLGVIVSFLIGGAVIIETVFAVPGLGRLMIYSIISRDYFVVQGLTLFFAMGAVLVTLVVDIISAAIDPRVKL